MAEILIRSAVSPDIDLLSGFNHTVKTTSVWQMYRRVEENEIRTDFKEIILPREMRIIYPRSPKTLLQRWKEYSTILVGCIDNVPVSYITISTFFAPEMVWIKDLVVDKMWRRQDIGTTLIKAAIEWAKARNYYRMTVEMSSKNYPAICLVKKLKFEFSGFNDNYFTNNDLALFFARFI
ncbi:MAG: GNAT family N-acetyltransferase [Anaerolineaceae bacterium]|nr:GNAT family N-acetyltransferase [Anaerolineaceae bacterium]